MEYSPLEDKSEHDSQPTQDYEALLSNTVGSKGRQTRRDIVLLSAIVLPIISFCFLALGAWIGSTWFANPNDFCPSYVQHYSPILNEVDTSLHNVQFNGSFLKANVFRQDAGPEVDAAWASLGVNYRSLRISPKEAEKSGLNPDQVQISEKYGGGFPANVEGLHHLHCLNLVRQALYFNFDYYKEKGKGAFVNEDNIVKYHVSHCLDIIRQQLMCQPDTGVLGQVWWDKSAPKAFVDFNTYHKCKNFDAIRDWAEEHQIPETVPNDFLKPPADGEAIYQEIP